MKEGLPHPKTILEALDTRAKKRLSQSFLTSRSWAEKLAMAALASPKAEEIWEVGPGLGAITSELLKKTDLPIIVFEIDSTLSSYLKNTYPRIRVVEGDFQDYPISAGKTISLVSNLPYHIGSQIFFKLLEHWESFSCLVLTFQKEFADRLVAKPKTKAYGAVSVQAQLVYEMENVGVIPPGAFYPTPAVNSRAISFRPLSKLGADPLTLKLLVRAAFRHRRKLLIKNLIGEHPEFDWKRHFADVSLGENVRAEEVPPEIFWKLSQYTNIKNK